MWVKFTGHSEHMVGNLRTKLRLAGVQHITVIDRKTTVAEIRDDHRAWSESLAREYNHAWALNDKPETLIPSKCGKVYFISHLAYRTHTGGCKACHAIKPTQKVSVAKPRAGKAEAIVTVPGLQHMSVNGLLSLMQERLDKLMEMAQEYDSAIKALKGLDALDAELSRLISEKEQHSKALAIFMGKEK